jgi:hypothetical protein
VVVAGITRRPSFSCFEFFFYIKIKMEEEHCFGNVTALRFGVVRLWELLARPAVAPGEHRHRPKAMSVSTSKAYSRPWPPEHVVFFLRPIYTWVNSCVKIRSVRIMLEEYFYFFWLSKWDVCDGCIVSI